MPIKFKSDLEIEQERGSSPTPSTSVTPQWESQYSPSSLKNQSSENFTGTKNYYDIPFDNSSIPQMGYSSVDKLYERIGPGIPQKQDLANKESDRYQYEADLNARIAHLSTPGFIPSNVGSYEEYDIGKPHYANLNDWRAERQSVAEKFGRASLAWTGIIGSTFAETFTSIPGLVYGVSQGNWSTDPVTKIYDRLNNYIEESNPIYRSSEEMNRPFYKNFGTANFWIDDVFKNSGFAIGDAFGIMATAGIGSAALGLTRGIKAFEAMSKLAMAGKVIDYTADAAKYTDDIISAAKKITWLNKANMFAATFAGSAAESRIQGRGAIEVTRDDLIREYQESHGGEMPGPDEMREIENAAIRTGNTVFAFNMPLLLTSNAWQFGKALTRTFGSDMIKFNKVLAKDPIKLGVIEAMEDGSFKAAKLSGMDKSLLWGKSLFASPVREGIYEEMGQYAIDRGAEDYWERYYKGDNIHSIRDMMESIAFGLNESYGSEEGWKQGTIGFIMGALGIPGVKTVTKQDGGVKKQFGMMGGVWTNPVAEINRSTQAAVDALNNNPLTADLFKNAMNYLSSQERYDKSIINEDKFQAENAKMQDFISMVDTYNKVGLLDVLKDRLESLKTASVEDFSSILGYEAQTLNKLDIVNKVDNLIKKTNRIVDVSNAVDIRYRGLQSDIRDQLIYSSAMAEDSDIRIKDLLQQISSETLGTDMRTKVEDLGKLNFSHGIENDIIISSKLRRYNQLIEKQGEKDKDGNPKMSTEEEVELMQLKEDLRIFNNKTVSLDKYQKTSIELAFDDIQKEFGEWAKNTPGYKAEQVKTKIEDAMKLIQQKQHYIDLYAALSSPEGREEFSRKLEELRLNRIQKGGPQEPGQPSEVQPEQPQSKGQRQRTEDKRDGIKTQETRQSSTAKKEIDKETPLAFINGALDANGNFDITFNDGTHKDVQKLWLDLGKYLTDNEMIDPNKLKERFKQLREESDKDLGRGKKKFKAGQRQFSDAVLNKLLEELEAQGRLTESVAPISDTVNETEKPEINNDEVAEEKKPIKPTRVVLDFTSYNSFERSDRLAIGGLDSNGNIKQMESDEAFVDNISKYKKPYFYPKLMAIQNLPVEQRSKETRDLRDEYNREVAKANKWLIDFKVSKDKPIKIKYVVTQDSTNQDTSGANIQVFVLNDKGEPLFNYSFPIADPSSNTKINKANVDSLIKMRQSILNAQRQGLEVYGNIIEKGDGNFNQAKGNDRRPLLKAIPTILNEDPQIGIVMKDGAVRMEGDRFMEMNREAGKTIYVADPKDKQGRLLLDLKSLNGRTFGLMVYTAKLNKPLSDLAFDLMLGAIYSKNGLNTLLAYDETYTKRIKEKYGISVGSDTMTIKDLLDMIVLNGKDSIGTKRPLDISYSNGIATIKFGENTETIPVDQLKDPAIMEGLREKVTGWMQKDAFFHFEFNNKYLDKSAKGATFRFDIDIKEADLSFKKGDTYAKGLIKNNLIETSQPEAKEFDYIDKDGKVQTAYVRPHSSPVVVIDTKISTVGKSNDTEKITDTGNVRFVPKKGMEALKPLGSKSVVLPNKDAEFYEDKDGNKYGRISSLRGVAPDNEQVKIGGQRGDLNDHLLRLFFDGQITAEQFEQVGNELIAEKGMKIKVSKEAYQQLGNILSTIKNQLDSAGFSYDTTGVTLWGELNGKPMAGTMDIIAKKGNDWFIIDLKTSNTNRVIEYNVGEKGVKEKDSVQLNGYRELLQQRTGIDAKLSIFPIQAVLDAEDPYSVMSFRLNESTNKEGRTINRIEVESKPMSEIMPDIEEDDADVGPGYEVFMLADKDIKSTPTTFEQELANVNKVLGDVNVKENQGLIEVSGNRKAFGMMMEDAITLSDVGAEGRGYHEAFHRVSLLLLSKEDRARTYAEAKAKSGILEDTQVEEWLAERFREYAISKDNRGLGQRIIDMFNRILNSIKKLMGLKQNEIDMLFNRIYSGEFRNKEVLKENLGTVGTRYMIDGTPFNLNQIKDIAKGLGAYAILYKGVENIEHAKINTQDLLNFVESQIDYHTDRLELVKSKADKAKKQSDIDYFTDIKEHFPKVMEYVEHYLREFSIVRDEEMDNDNDEPGENQHYISQELRKKDSTTSSARVRFMLSTLPKMEMKNSKASIVIDNFTRMPQFVPKGKLWDMLKRNLTGKRTYKAMYETLTELSETYPELIKLQDRLNKSNEVTRTQFFNEFSQAEHRYVNMILDVKIAEKEGESNEYDITISNADLNQSVQMAKDAARKTFREKIGKVTTDKLNALKTRANDIYSELDELIKVRPTLKGSDKASSTVKINNLFRTMLSEFGVNVDSRTVSSYLKGKENLGDINKQLYGELVTGTYSALNSLRSAKPSMPIDKSAIMRDIVSEIAKTDAYASSMIIGKKDSKQYRFRDKTFLDDQISDLNDDYNNVRQSLAQVPYNQNSLVLEHLNKSKDNKLTLLTLNTYGRKDAMDTNLSFNEYVGKDDYIIKAVALMENLLVLPTMSSASTYRFVDGFKFEDYNLVDLGNGLQFGSDAIEQMFNYYLDEYNTIKSEYNAVFTPSGRVKKNLDTDLILNYHYKLNKDGSKNFKEGNAYKFSNIFSMLNTEEFFTEEGALKDVNPAVVKQKIREALDNRLTRELRTMLNMGVIGSVSADRKAGTKAGYVNKTLPKRYLDSIEGFTTQDNKIRSLVANILMRNIVSTIETSKILSGNFAYYKDSQDITKRLVELRSSREASRLDNDVPSTYSFAIMNELIINEVALINELKGKLTNEYAKYLYATNGKRKGMELSSSDYSKLDEKEQAFVYKEVAPILDSFKGNAITDAAVFITPQRAKALYKDYYGDWDNVKEKYFDKLVKGEIDESMKDNPEFFEFMIQPLKDVHYGMTYKDNRAVPNFIKNAKFILWPSMYKGTIYESILKHMEANGIDEIGMPNSIKVGATNIANVINVDEQDSITIGDLNELKPMILEQRFNGRQLIIPMKETMNMKVSTQAVRQVMANIVNEASYNVDGNIMTGKDVKALMNTLRSELSEIGKDRFETKFGISDGVIVDAKNFASEIKKAMVKSGMELNAIKSIIDENGELYSLDLLPNARYTTHKSIIGAIKRNNVDLSLNGRALVQSPDVDFSTDLKMVTSGKRVYAEAKVSVALYKNIIPGYSKKTFAEKEAWLMKNRGVIKGVGYYMPTQSTTSIVPIQVVGFIEEQFGNEIILPKSITKFTGKDFDIDELYLINFNYTTNDKGEVSKVSYLEPKKNESEEDFFGRVYEDRIEQLKNAIKNLYYRIDNELITDDIQETITELNSKAFNPLSIDEVEALAIATKGDIKAIKDALKKMEEMPTKADFISQNKGKSAVGVNSKAAIENRYLETWMSIFESDNHYIQNTIPLDHSTQYLKGIRKEIMDFNEIKETDLEPMELGSLAYQVQKKAENMLGKMQGVATSSLMSSFLPIAQQVGMVATTTIPYLNTVMIDNQLYNSFKEIYNEDGKFISNIIMGVQNGFVDIEKDTWIMDLGLNQYTLKTALTLTQGGMGEHLWWVLQSPALRFLSESYDNSLLTGTKWPKPYGNAIKKIYARINKIKDTYDSTVQYEEDRLKIIDYDKIEPSFFDIQTIKDNHITAKQDEANMVLLEAKRKAGRGITKAEAERQIDKYIIQIAIMKQWIQMDNLSRAQWNIIYNSRSDNKNYGSSITEIQRFVVKSGRPFQQDGLFLASDNESTQPISAIFDTYLGTLRENGPVYTLKIFENTSIRANLNYSKVVEDFIQKYDLIAGSQAENNKIYEKVSDLLFSSIISKYLFDSGTTSYDRVKGMLFGDNSLDKRLLNLKSSPKANTLTDYLRPIGNESIPGMPNTISAPMIDKSDKDLKNEITKDWNNMYNDAQTKQLAIDLAVYAILQSGYTNRANSFAYLIPIEILVDLGLDTHLKELNSDSVSFEDYTESMESLMWMESSVVPVVGLGRNDIAITEMIGDKEFYQVIAINQPKARNAFNEPKPYVQMADKRGNSHLFQLVGTNNKQFVYARVSKKGFSSRYFDFTEAGMEQSLFESNNVTNKYMYDANASKLIQQYKEDNKRPFSKFVPYISDTTEVKEEANTPAIVNGKDAPSLNDLINDDMTTHNKTLVPGAYNYNGELVEVTSVTFGDIKKIDSQQWWDNLIKGNREFSKKYPTVLDYISKVSKFGESSIEKPNSMTDALISELRDSYENDTEMGLVLLNKEKTIKVSEIEQSAEPSLFDKVNQVTDIEATNKLKEC